MLPWSEMDSLQLETGYIKDQLVALNKKGFLTINSQPCVNGQPSTDEKVGWGGPNGWAYLFPAQDGKLCAGRLHVWILQSCTLSKVAVTHLPILCFALQGRCAEVEVDE